jgi:hypothetical protein
MISNSIIVFLSEEEKEEICDFLPKTAKLLSQENTVIIIQLNKMISIKEFLIEKYTNKSKYSLIEKKNNIYYLSPLLIIPFKRSSKITKLNLYLFFFFFQIILKTFFLGKRKFLWMFFPNLSHFLIYFTKDWFVIYDIVDFFSSPNKKKNHQLKLKKKYLLERSRLIVSVSHSLKEIYQKITDKKIFVVPQGFSKPIKTKVEPSQTNEVKTIGYIGHINNRFDFNILKKLIISNKNINFVFVGPIHFEKNISQKNIKDNIEWLVSQKNTILTGEKPKSIIYEYINKFDICIIPYDIQFSFNKYCYPMKLFEYFYSGKPVISTPIKELKREKFSSLLYIGENYEQWQQHIDFIFNNNHSSITQKKQKMMALKNSWLNKINSISKLIE